MSRPARRLFSPDAFAAVRRTPTGGLYVDEGTLSVDAQAARLKAGAKDRQLPVFGRDYPVLDVVRVMVRIEHYTDEDRLKEAAREEPARERYARV